MPVGGGVERLYQFGNAAVAVKQQKKDGHTFGVGNQFENGRETLDFHIIVPYCLLYECLI